MRLVQPLQSQHQEPRVFCGGNLEVCEVGIQCHQRSSLALADFDDVPVRMPTEPLVEDSQGIVPSLAQAEGAPGRRGVSSFSVVRRGIASRRSALRAATRTRPSHASGVPQPLRAACRSGIAGRTACGDRPGPVGPSAAAESPRARRRSASCAPQKATYPAGSAEHLAAGRTGRSSPALPAAHRGTACEACRRRCESSWARAARLNASVQRHRVRPCA
jgi:hypothetical protein